MTTSRMMRTMSKPPFAGSKAELAGATPGDAPLEALKAEAFVRGKAAFAELGGDLNKIAREFQNTPVAQYDALTPLQKRMASGGV